MSRVQKVFCGRKKWTEKGVNSHRGCSYVVIERDLFEVKSQNPLPAVVYNQRSQRTRLMIGITSVSNLRITYLLNGLLFYFFVKNGVTTLTPIPIRCNPCRDPNPLVVVPLVFDRGVFYEENRERLSSTRESLRTRNVPTTREVSKILLLPLLRSSSPR